MDDQTGPVVDGMADPKARTTTLFGPRVRLAAFILLIGAAVAFFAITAFKNATVYYMTVGELEVQGPTEEGRLVRVAGTLVQDSFLRAENGIDVSFQLQDGEGSVLPVDFKGDVGQLFFNEYSTIVLEGAYGTNGIFGAEKLIISCPSKYQNQGDEEPAGSNT